MMNLTRPSFEMATFFEHTPDLVCIAGKDGFFKEVNQAVIDKLGYTKAELLALPISHFMHPDDREITLKKREQLLQGKTLVNFENRYISKTGRTIWLHWTSVYYVEQEVVFALAKDITERKRAEQEISEKYKQLEGLASHFKTSIDKDRKHFAVTLYDELAQLAAALKMDINFISDHEENLAQASQARLGHARELCELMMTTIQRLSFSISPNMLDDLGLNATLEWLCQEFTRLHRIPCHYHFAYDEENLTREIQLDFFSICQEALRNVMHHAEASQVNLQIRTVDDKVILTIADDGKGFDVQGLHHSHGLTAMKQRAASVHGQFHLDTQPGKGTTVSVVIALHLANNTVTNTGD